MAYLLLNRLHGALQGAFLGEALGRSLTASSELEPQLQLASMKLESLEFCQEICTGCALISSGIPPGNQRDRWQKSARPSASGLATAIPLGLFFHENPPQLAQRLKQLIQSGLIPPEFESPALAIAIAIATTLQAQRPPVTLVSTILAALEPEPTFLRQQLEQVQPLLNHSVGLAQTCQQLLVPPRDELSAIETALALAIYCFLSTAVDFRLSVLRSVQGGHLAPLTTMLTGALSGAYNGKTEILGSWRSLPTLPTVSLSLYQHSHTLAAQLAEPLWSAWSGYYQLASPFPPAVASVVTSAPGLLRRH